VDGALWDEQIRNTEAVRAVGLEGFHAAVAAFTAQLDAPLTGGATDGYCVGFYTVPSSPLFAGYRMVGHSCYVRFEAGPRGGLEAWVESHVEEDQLVVLRWSGGTWAVIGKGVATQVDD
jgi:hypothetical protein